MYFQTTQSIRGGDENNFTDYGEENNLTSTAVTLEFSSHKRHDNFIFNSTNLEPCSSGFMLFGDTFMVIGTYANLLTCLFGTIVYILCVAVLRRKDVLNPTNAILIGIALVDVINMILFLSATVFGTLSCIQKTDAWSWSMIIHSNLSQVCHSISVWLNVVLAIWRYIMVAFPLKSKVLCTMERVKRTIGLIYTAVAIGVSANIIYVLWKLSEGGNATVFSYKSGQIGLKICFPEGYKLSFIKYLLATCKTHYVWLYSVGMKLIPCTSAVVVNFLLLHSLNNASKRRDKLLLHNHVIQQGNCFGESEHRKMKIAIVIVIFIMAEFPVGLLGLLSGMGDSIFRCSFVQLAYTTEIFSRPVSLFSFSLHCIMNIKFRHTFSEMYLRCGFLEKLVTLLHNKWNKSCTSVQVCLTDSKQESNAIEMSNV